MCHDLHRTAAYHVLTDGGGMRFRFYCELSGAAICTTQPMPLQPIEAALEKAWRLEGREHFNLCHRCGRWISDVMYNPNTLECVKCSPWEEKPIFCSRCGVKASDDMVFCNHCGARLQYGGEHANGSR